MTVNWNSNTIAITLSMDELEVELDDLGIELNSETCNDVEVLHQIAEYCLVLCAQARPETMQLVNAWSMTPLILNLTFTDVDVQIVLHPADMRDVVKPTDVMPSDINSIEYDFLGQADLMDNIEGVPEDKEVEPLLSDAEKAEIQKNVHEQNQADIKQFEEDYAQGKYITDEYIDEGIEYYLTHVMRVHPNVKYRQMESTLLSLPMFYQYIQREISKLPKNLPNDIKAQNVRKFIGEYKKRISKIYDSLVVIYFYKMPDMHIALRAVKTISHGSLIYVKDTYYILTNYQAISLSDYGTQVPGFVYVDSSVIGYIENGELVAKSKG